MPKKKVRNSGCGSCVFFQKHEDGFSIDPLGVVYTNIRCCLHPKNTYKEYRHISGELKTRVKNIVIERRWNKNGYCKKFIEEVK